MSCNDGSRCPQPINCSSSKCPVDQVICINCCVPISVTCNSTSSQTVFQAINPCDRVDGMVEICQLQCPASCFLIVGVTDENGFSESNFAGAGFGGICGQFRVQGLRSITVTANAVAGGATTEILRAEADFQLRKIIQLDC